VSFSPEADSQLHHYLFYDLTDQLSMFLNLSISITAMGDNTANFIVCGWGGWEEINEMNPI
jgi:hypothetical protein